MGPNLTGQYILEVPCGGFDLNTSIMVSLTRAGENSQERDAPFH